MFDIAVDHLKHEREAEGFVSSQAATVSTTATRHQYGIQRKQLPCFLYRLLYGCLFRGSCLATGPHATICTFGLV
jgi:hypothetical protein